MVGSHIIESVTRNFKLRNLALKSKLFKRGIPWGVSIIKKTYYLILFKDVSYIFGNIFSIFRALYECGGGAFFDFEFFYRKELLKNS